MPISFIAQNPDLLLGAVALIPALVLLVMVYRHDKIEKEPLGLLLLLLIGGGAGSVVLSILGETVLQNVLDSFLSPYDSAILYYVLLAFIVVACVEEGTKLLFLKLFSWKHSAFNYTFDAVVYAVFVSLGFAAIENVKYAFNYGLTTAISRAFTAVPGHMSFAILMGVFFGRAKLCESLGLGDKARKNLILSFLVPMAFHGFYDAACMINTGISTLVFLVFLVLMYILVFRLLRSASRYDRPVA